MGVEVAYRGKKVPILRVEYRRPKMYPYQTDFMDGQERYSVIEASTKVGKTAAMIVWLFEQALNGKPGYNYIWLAPIFAQSKVAFKRMLRQGKIIQGDKNKPFFKVNKSNLTLELPNKTVIHFRSAERPDNLYGDDYQAAVFDEASRSSQEAWNALRSTVTKTGGKVKFIANVRGRGWYYKLAQQAKNGDDPNYKHYKITCWDAICTGRLNASEVIASKSILVEHGVFDKLLAYATSINSAVHSPAEQQLSLAEILDARKSGITKAAFRETFEAEPSEDGGNPFGIDAINKAARPVIGNNFTISNGRAECLGIDLASRVDYTVVIGLTSTKEVCLFNRYQVDWPKTTELIKQTPDIPTAIDGTGVGAPVVAELQRNRRNTEGIIFTAQSKQRLMEGLTTAFQMSDILIPDSGPLYDELISFEYTFTRTGGVRYEAPTGLHDDCVMALALAYDRFRVKPVQIQKPKAIVPQLKKRFTA